MKRFQWSDGTPERNVRDRPVSSDFYYSPRVPSTLEDSLDSWPTRKTC